MHSYTLSNWDGSQSSRQTSLAAIEKTNDGRPNTPFNQRDGSISPNTPTFGPTSNGRLPKGATRSAVPVESPVSKLVEHVNSQEVAVANNYLKSCDTPVQRIEQGNQHAFGLAALMSEVAQAPSSQPITSVHSRTLSSDRIQVQVEVKAQPQTATTKAGSGLPTRITASTPTSIISRGVQSAYSSANFIPHPDHTQDTPSKLSHSDNGINSTLSHPDTNKPYDRKPRLPDKKAPFNLLSPTRLASNLSTTPTSSERVQAIPNIELSRFHHVQPKDSRPPIASTPTTKQAQSQSPSTSPAFSTTQRKATLLHPKTILQPVAQANHQRRSPKLALEPSISSTKFEHNLVKTAVASLPLRPDPLISTPTSHQDVNSDYTSADADGESVDDLDLETLEPSQSAKQSRTSLSSKTTAISENSQSSSTQQLNYGSKLVYDFFTPPPTRSPSQPPHPSIHRKLPRVSSLQFVCVEIPPLIPGRNKADYRPLKRLERTSTRKYARRLMPEDADAACEDAEQERPRRRPGRRARKSVEQKSKSTMIQTHPVASASLSTRAAPDRRTTYNQDRQQGKSVLSNLSMRQSNKNSSKSGQSIGLSVSEKEGEQDSLPVSACPDPVPSFPASLHLDERIKSSGSLPIPSPKSKEPSSTVFDNPSAQEIQFEYAEHTSATVVYFNTRFAQTALDASKWTVLGMRTRLKCVMPQRSFVESGDEEEVELEDNFSVGGPLLWMGCQFFDKELTPSPVASQNGQEGASTPIKLTGEGRNLNFSRVASSPPSAMMVPKLDLTRAYKSQKVASSRKRQRRRDQEGAGPRAEDPTSLPDALVPNSGSLKQRQILPPSHANPQQDIPHYLSEKARGKQKAVESDSFDTTPANAPPVTIPSPTSLMFTPYSLTALADTVTGPLQPSNPHDAFERTMGDYIAFNLSPDKSSNQGNSGGSNMASSSRFPTVVGSGLGSLSSATMSQHFENPFYTQSDMEDIFLAPHALGSPVPNNLDSSRDGYCLLLDDPLGVAFLEGEQSLDQLTTINPAFLEGGPRGDDNDSRVKNMDFVLGGMSGEETASDQGFKDNLGTSVSDDTLPDLSKGYQLTASSLIFTSGVSSLAPPITSRGQSQTRSESALLSRVAARDLSPEFPEYEVANTPSQRSGYIDQSLHISSRSPSVLIHREPAVGHAKGLVFDDNGDKLEENEVQRGLVAYELGSEEYVVASPSPRDPPLTQLPRRVLATQTRVRPSVVTSKRPGPLLSRTKKRAPRHRQEWPMGEEETFCHQCRRKTRYLKMSCPCNKKYCSRCMALRYPERPFCLELDDLDCPSCRNECNCDVCSRKRGEDYISLRVSLAQARSPPLPIYTSTSFPDEARTPPTPVVDLAPLPDNIRDIAGPFTYWGSIYDREGIKFADGFADPGDKVVIAHVIDGYTGPIQGRIVPSNVEPVDADGFPISRTFIGACQPSWRLGKTPIIKELGKRGRVRRVRDDEEYQVSAETHWFVGKEYPLHLPVVAYARDLRTPNLFNDLSSLSSLSDDSDVEIGLDSAVPSASLVSECTTPHHINPKISVTDTIKDLDFDPNIIETKDTIRALRNALEACGMVAKTEGACVDP